MLTVRPLNVSGSSIAHVSFAPPCVSCGPSAFVMSVCTSRAFLSPCVVAVTVLLLDESATVLAAFGLLVVLVLPLGCAAVAVTFKPGASVVLLDGVTEQLRVTSAKK